MYERLPYLISKMQVQYGTFKEKGEVQYSTGKAQSIQSARVPPPPPGRLNWLPSPPPPQASVPPQDPSGGTHTRLLEGGGGGGEPIQMKGQTLRYGTLYRYPISWRGSAKLNHNTVWRRLIVYLAVQESHNIVMVKLCQFLEKKTTWKIITI